VPSIPRPGTSFERYVEAVTWWREGVLYQVYPRSFADSDGDGVGDLPGVISKLDYLEWLGVDGLWLSPIHPSPNADWGYDVADYLGVDPDLGTLDDVDGLVAEADARGIRVLLDLVPNHTSDRHPWFSDPAKRDWYVWADRPNNWTSTFGGPAWTRDTDTDRYYLHNFLPEQPDLNWWSEGVREAFDEILRFWFDRGIAGFRIDVAHGLVKDERLRDNPVVGEADDPREERVYNMNRPEVHDVYRRWRRIAREYDPERLLLGETWVPDADELARYYGADDELQLAMNFAFVLADLEAAELSGTVAKSEAAFPPGSWPVWCASNHDVVRFPTRWAGGDEARTRCALLVIATLRGTPILYYGDELGMEQTTIPLEAALDPVALRLSPEKGRDGARTPMPWTPTGEEWRDPWLPLGDLSRNVADQRGDARSTLAFTRELLALRRRSEALRRAPYEPLDAPEGVWVWRRGEGATVAVNLSDRAAKVRGIEGSIRLDTTGERAGEVVGADLGLRAWEGVLVLAG
jgi:alpha-glucosidase